MKKILLCAIAALALPAPAAAKEIQSLSVCGAAGCARVDDATAHDSIALLQRGGALDEGDVSAPVAAAPYYRLVFTIGEGNGKSFQVRLWYVRPGLTRESPRDGFRQVPAELRAGIDTAAARVQAFPAPR